MDGTPKSPRRWTLARARREARSAAVFRKRAQAGFAAALRCILPLNLGATLMTCRSSGLEEQILGSVLSGGLAMVVGGLAFYRYQARCWHGQCLAACHRSADEA